MRILGSESHEPVGEGPRAAVGAVAAAGEGASEDPVIKDLALQCFDPADPAEAFLRDYVQRQAWRDDGEGSPLPVGGPHPHFHALKCVTQLNSVPAPKMDGRTITGVFRWAW